MLNDEGRKEAFAAIDHARELRFTLRRRTKPGSPQRNRQLEAAGRRLAKSMRRVRRELHRTQFWGDDNIYRQNMKLLSKDLQKERRKIWKMMQPSKRSDVNHEQVKIQKQILANQREAERTFV